MTSVTVFTSDLSVHRLKIWLRGNTAKVPTVSRRQSWKTTTLNILDPTAPWSRAPIALFQSRDPTCLGKCEWLNMGVFWTDWNVYILPPTVEAPKHEVKYNLWNPIFKRRIWLQNSKIYLLDPFWLQVATGLLVRQCRTVRMFLEIIFSTQRCG